MAKKDFQHLLDDPAYNKPIVKQGRMRPRIVFGVWRKRMHNGSVERVPDLFILDAAKHHSPWKIEEYLRKGFEVLHYDLPTEKEARELGLVQDYITRFASSKNPFPELKAFLDRNMEGDRVSELEAEVERLKGIEAKLAKKKASSKKAAKTGEKAPEKAQKLEEAGE